MGCAPSQQRRERRVMTKMTIPKVILTMKNNTLSWRGPKIEVEVQISYHKRMSKILIVYGVPSSWMKAVETKEIGKQLSNHSATSILRATYDVFKIQGKSIRRLSMGSNQDYPCLAQSNVLQ
jgi:hypothetical protein